MLITNEEILEYANTYAREATSTLSQIKGFPLTEKQILGFLEIYAAYQKASMVIYQEEGRDVDNETFFSSIYEDFHDFLETDIHLDRTLCFRLVMEFCAQKVTAIYCLKNNISNTKDIRDSEEMIRKLINEDRWEEIQRLSGIEELWQEI